MHKCYARRAPQTAFPGSSINVSTELLSHGLGRGENAIYRQKGFLFKFPALDKRPGGAILAKWDEQTISVSLVQNNGQQKLMEMLNEATDLVEPESEQLNSVLLQALQVA